jgi:hypothetical protein
LSATFSYGLKIGELDMRVASNHIRHKRLTAVSIAAILLIAALGAILAYRYYDNTITNATETSSGISSLGTVLSTSDYNSSLGLRLTLNIGRSTLPQDEGVSMSISLDNTLNTQNNVTRGKPISLNLGPCPVLPLGVGIFQGNYDIGNVSQGEPLGLVSPGSYSCPATGVAVRYSFAPLSDKATPVGQQTTEEVASSIEYWGYWTGQPPFYPPTNAAFQSFSPGIYTMVGEDDWGQVTVLHFRVIANDSPLDCATITSNSSFMAGKNFSATAGPLSLESYYQNPRSNNTVVLALSNTGGSALTLLFFGNYSTTYGGGQVNHGSTSYEFSPDAGQIQRWQYYAPNGTLSYPAVFYPNECSLISVTLPYAFAHVPLTIGFTDNQNQTFTFNP